MYITSSAYILSLYIKCYAIKLSEIFPVEACIQRIILSLESQKHLGIGDHLTRHEELNVVRLN